MTYNSDPDRWYANESAFLDRQRLLGIISETEYRIRAEDLERRYQALWQRLDGGYWAHPKDPPRPE